MGKYFPKLTQRHVRLDVAEGQSIVVPMLPVGEIKTLADFSDRLATSNKMTEIEAVRREMIALARTVLPDSCHGNLERFGIDTLSELLAYLMYGDGDDQPLAGEAEPEKK